MKKAPFLQSLHILMPLLLDLALTRALVMLARMILTLAASSSSSAATYYINNSGFLAVIIDAAATLIVAVFFFFAYKNESEDKMQPNRTYPVLFILGITLSLFLNMVFDFAHLTTASEAYKSIASIQYSVSLPLGLLIYGLIKPVEEELVYRGLFYGRLRKTFPAHISIPVSSLFFGLLHFNLTQMVYAFLMGLYLSIVKERENSLIPCIIIHSLANIVIFTTSGNETLYNTIYTLPCCIIAGVLSLLAILYLYVKIKKGSVKEH